MLFRSGNRTPPSIKARLLRLRTPAMAQIHTVASPASNSPSTADAAQSAVADVVKPLPRDPAGDAAATASPVGADAVATPLDAGAGAVAAALQNHAHVMAAGGGLRSTYALPNGLGYMLRSGTL